MSDTLRTNLQKDFRHLKCFYANMNLTEFCSKRFNKQQASHGSDNRFVPIRRQVFTLTNDGLVNCRMYVSFGPD